MTATFLQDLGYSSGYLIWLYCDNKTTSDITNNLVQHDCPKYVKVDRFFIKMKLHKKILEQPKIRSKY